MGWSHAVVYTFSTAFFPFHSSKLGDNLRDTKTTTPSNPKTRKNTHLNIPPHSPILKRLIRLRLIHLVPRNRMPHRRDRPLSPRRLQRFRLLVQNPAVFEIALLESRTGMLLLAAVDALEHLVALLTGVAEIFEGLDGAAVVFLLLDAKVGGMVLAAEEEGDAVGGSGGDGWCWLEGRLLLLFVAVVVGLGRTAA